MTACHYGNVECAKLLARERPQWLQVADNNGWLPLFSLCGGISPLDEVGSHSSCAGNDWDDEVEEEDEEGDDLSVLVCSLEERDELGRVSLLKTLLKEHTAEEIGLMQSDDTPSKRLAVHLAAMMDRPRLTSCLLREILSSRR